MDLFDSIFIKMNELKSSIPGLVYLPTRDHSKSPDGFLEGRKQIDGAKNLWRINNRLYNLDEFINNHPGGAEWITLTRGTDITELFEVNKKKNKNKNKIFFVCKIIFKLFFSSTDTSSFK